MMKDEYFVSFFKLTKSTFPDNGF